MVQNVLPCIDKNCTSKMILTENNDKLLYYNCQQKHSDHTFRYDIDQKKWEKIIIKTKLILHYKKNPLDEPETPTTTIKTIKSIKPVNKLKKTTSKPKIATKHNNLTKIQGIGTKRAKKLEIAGVRTIADLAKRSPKNLAKKTGIPLNQISIWIMEANKIKNSDKILA
jgi:predicted flap endonuclease-1-like 5' DNA nuclease